MLSWERGVMSDDERRYWRQRDRLRPDEPCSHPGCLSHVTHPCEGCGRIAGRYPAPTPTEDPTDE